MFGISFRNPFVLVRYTYVVSMITFPPAPTCEAEFSSLKEAKAWASAVAEGFVEMGDHADLFIERHANGSYEKTICKVLPVVQVVFERF